MLFNSLQFFVFFFVVYSLYLASKHKWQNRMLLVASYVFYGTWDWRFLSLIVISTVIDYYCGIRIDETNDIKKRKRFLAFSIVANLSILGFFKYFNFFAENLQGLLGILGLQVQPHFLNIILPVGISFYTFQTMSYTLDIYRGQLKPTRKFLDFALFVSFFPQLVAGPIERASHLLPQVLSKRKVTLDKFYEGCYLIFWGLFLKVFVADNLATLVDPVFASEPPYSGAKVLLALYAFAFQIFGDFAGYSNIARGLGKCMGFDIMVNFNLPYFATNPSDFWRRWHISLSTWLRDYLYIPLGGNKRGTVFTYRNLAITMLLGGLWHGAAWTFVIWGAYQGVLLVIHRLARPVLELFPKIKNHSLRNIWWGIRVFFFFHLVCLGWLFFRADSCAQVFEMFSALGSGFHSLSRNTPELRSLLFYSLPLILIQCWQYRKNDLMIIREWPPYVRFSVLFILLNLMIFLSSIKSSEFIYFQF